MWTYLGWVVGGPTGKKKKRRSNNLSMINIEVDQDQMLHELVKNEFRLEALGLINCSKLPQSKANEQAVMMMDKMSRRAGDRWETGLLWKSEDLVMPESYGAAFKRLKTLEKQMDKDELFARMYEKKIEEYLEKGFCRKLNEVEAAVHDGQVWYLSHFGVTNVNKPGNLRLVFDCAAKSNGMSFNDAFLQGADLLCPLSNVLIKFRQFEVAFCGDIRDMFHMVQMNKKSALVRFLWRGRDRNRKPDVYVMTVLLFGGVGSPFLAQYIKNRNAEEFITEYPEAVEAIVKRHYMDDYADSCPTVEAAIMEVREIHRRGGFEIRGWLSNEVDVIKVVDPTNANNNHQFEVKEDAVERILGLYWDPKTDKFKYKTSFRNIDEKIINGNVIPTKRELLRLIMSLFDPLGFITHLTVRGRILLQDVWKTATGCDEKIKPELEVKWRSLLSQIHKISKAEIPRCLSPEVSNATNLQLHVMCDASQLAYCCVAYLRAVGRGGQVKCNIIMAKARVAPIKSKSIPRMEMEAALMDTRLSIYLKKNLDLRIDSTVLWSDSKNVLCWLRSADPAKFKMFVAYRIADASPNSRWFRGPDFLYEVEDKWPVEKGQELAAVNKDELELKRECCLLIKKVDNFICVENDSDRMRLVRVTAWIHRFINNIANKKRDTRCKSNSLLIEEVEKSVRSWILQTQVECFAAEKLCLERGEPVDRASRLFMLSPILVNGVICVKSRLENAPEIANYGKYPAMLDAKHPWTKLLIAWYHRTCGHHGIEMICNEIRQRFWILSLKAAVKKAAKECLECALNAAKKIIPEMAALPEVRVKKPPRPFSYVGVDYFGPTEVINGRKREKRYGALFTCLSTREVHLELVFSLSTDDFIMALRRFIGRRGEPMEMWSDNGTNFRGAVAEFCVCSTRE